MFEIDRLYITTKLENKKIIEENYYAIFGNNAVELNKKLFLLKNKESDESVDSNNLIEIYNNHLMEARALSIKDHLIDLEEDLDSCIQNNNLITSRDYDKFVYKEHRKSYEYIDESKVNDYIQTAIHFLGSELTKQSMIKLDTLAYYKAQKLLWEGKINDELSKIEKENIDEESDANED